MTTGEVTLVPDREVDPLLVRAYRDGQLAAWAVRDQFGWAIMARVPVWTLDSPVADREWRVKAVDRYEPYPGEASITVRVAALTGLARYATTGRTDVP